MLGRVPGKLSYRAEVSYRSGIGLVGDKQGFTITVAVTV